jgi:hypothetical protein
MVLLIDAPTSFILPSPTTTHRLLLILNLSQKLWISLPIDMTFDTGNPF